MARSSRAKALVALVLLSLTTTPAYAAPMPEADYRAAMTSLDEIETLAISTIDALHKGMTQDAARAALPLLQERLQWMRDIKVSAARIDRSHTLRTRNDDSQRAQCIIMRAGLMDESFQDVMVNVSMKAGGAGDDRLLPMNKNTTATFSAAQTC